MKILLCHISYIILRIYLVIFIFFFQIKQITNSNLKNHKFICIISKN